MSNLNIMVVDDDRLLVQSLVDMLEIQGYNAVPFFSADSAVKELGKSLYFYDIVLTDINMPSVDGYTFIKKIRNDISKTIQVLVLTGYGSIDGAVKAVKQGADAYFEKERDPELLLFEIKRIDEQLKLKRKLETLQQSAEGKSLYLFSSRNEATRKTFEVARKIAAKDVNVLITGESGTGKEILARFIHQKSEKSGRFVSINCSAVPDTLFESAMFGHVKGAFTDASSDKPGFFGQARGGTLLLDEVGELSPLNQAKLLKAIEEKTFFPVGSTEPMTTDCRLIAATNQDLTKKLQDKTFRYDFFYRINTVSIELPPLRQRREDIIDLAEIYLRFFAVKYQTHIYEIDEEGKKILTSENWHGNIRQLRQTIERCVLFASGQKVDADLIRQQLADNMIKPTHDCGETLKQSYKEAKTQFERLYFKNALTLVGNSVNEVAKMSGMNRTYIYQKIKELNLDI
jgi:DNA-binding NtrC family response regulator